MINCKIMGNDCEIIYLILMKTALLISWLLHISNPLECHVFRQFPKIKQIFPKNSNVLVYRKQEEKYHAYCNNMTK